MGVGPFWSENGYTLCLFLVWNLVWFSRELREHMNEVIVEFQMNKNQICEFEIRMMNSPFSSSLRLLN